MPFLMIGLQAYTLADSFAGEKERNTLEILMCLPVEMGALFWGKVMGILPIPVLVGLFGQGAMLAMLHAQGQWLPGFGAQALKAMALTPLLGLFLCALSVLVSLISESVRSAAQLCSLVMLAIFFTVTSFSGALYASDAVFLGVASALLIASGACFLAARRRFPRMI
jgi:ABC-type Na+ efflux pump permease subunit